MKKVLCLVAVCLLVAFSVSAQTVADEIEALLETAAVSYGQAARFVLDAADIGGMANQSQAFQYALERNWLPGNVSADDTARLDGIALLVMRSFNIKGGVMYSLFKRTSVRNPHYAYRELVHQEIIHGWIDPAMTVSGDTLLYIINRAIEKRDGEQ